MSRKVASIPNVNINFVVAKNLIRILRISALFSFVSIMMRKKYVKYFSALKYKDIDIFACDTHRETHSTPLHSMAFISHFTTNNIDQSYQRTTEHTKLACIKR